MIKVNDFYETILEAFANNKMFVFPIKGSSMQPLFHTGCRVMLMKIDHIKKNDIIFYKREDGSFVLHRVVKILNNHKLKMIGDHQLNYEIIDEALAFAKVYGYYKNDKLQRLKGMGYRLYCFSLKFRILRRIYAKWM